MVAHYTATGARDLEEAGWRITHLDRAFRGYRAGQLTSPAITRYIVDRQAAGAANGTINREVAVLLRMLRLGLEHHKVARLPVVHKPKEAAPRAGFFETDAFAAVRAKLPEDLQVAVTLAHTYEWRMQSEVLALGDRPARGAADRARRGSEGRAVMSAENAKLIIEESRTIRAEMAKVNPGSPRHKELAARLEEIYGKQAGR